MAELMLENLSKRLGGKVVIHRLNLAVRTGELVCLLGASGSGKTTTLRMVGGFIPVDGGRILINGVDVSALPPERRPTSMVFQSYALWPNMTVSQNISYGLRVQRVPRPEIRERVAEVLRLVGMGEHARRFPAQLSGGQQQRVALARSLVLRPQVLLLDEPLSNLDAKLRERVREEIREIQQRSGITTVFVTHDQEEALSISDRVALLVDGRIEQCDRPKNLYRQPASLHVATFIGVMNVIRGAIGTGEALLVEGVPVPCPTPAAAVEGPVDVAVRPEDVILGARGGAPAVVERRTPRGHYEELLVRAPFGRLRAFVGVDDDAMRPGTHTTLAFARVLAYRNGVLVGMSTDDVERRHAMGQ